MYIFCYWLVLHIPFMMFSLVCSSGRTQFEQLNRSQARRSVRFERQPSKRFSRRQSLEARERIKKGRRPPGAPQT